MQWIDVPTDDIVALLRDSYENKASMTFDDMLLAVRIKYDCPKTGVDVGQVNIAIRRLEKEGFVSKSQGHDMYGLRWVKTEG